MFSVGKGKTLKPILLLKVSRTNPSYTQEGAFANLVHHLSKTPSPSDLGVVQSFSEALRSKKRVFDLLNKQICKFLAFPVCGLTHADIKLLMFNSKVAFMEKKKLPGIASASPSK